MFVKAIFRGVLQGAETVAVRPGCVPEIGVCNVERRL